MNSYETCNNSSTSYQRQIVNVIMQIVELPTVMPGASAYILPSIFILINIAVNKMTASTLIIMIYTHRTNEKENNLFLF